MSSEHALSDELRRVVEARMESTLKGIEDTLQRTRYNEHWKTRKFV